MTEWLAVRVVLLGNFDAPLPRPPGRLLAVHPDHTFADLSAAIDTSFGRWDPSPGHEFLVEGRRLSSVEVAADDAADEWDDNDSAAVTVGEVGLRLGARFTYQFDLEEGWQHDCTVEDDDVNPFEVLGEEPDLPTALFGWGTVPDQYGRLTEDDDEGPEAPEAELDTSAGADESSWAVVASALARTERPRPDLELAAAAARLREHRDDGWPYDALVAAAGYAGRELPSDDEELWLALAAGIVLPGDELPVDDDTAAAWSALEPADWAGAVIELARAGEGTDADPESLLEAITRCPEVESDELEPQEEDDLLAGLEVVVELWRALLALDDGDRLTALGRWGLPEALRWAWSGPDSDAPGGPGA